MLRADQVDGVLRRGGSARLADEVPPRFAPGQQVRARNIHPQGHTRLPRYLRGRVASRHPLIVDDVITTGATGRQLAEVLFDAGVPAVSMLAIARVPGR